MRSVVPVMPLSHGCRMLLLLLLLLIVGVAVGVVAFVAVVVGVVVVVVVADSWSCRRCCAVRRCCVARHCWQSLAAPAMPFRCRHRHQAASIAAVA